MERIQGINDLGKKIRGIRGGVSQGQLAKKVGISQAFLSEIERGTKTPSIEVLQAIAKALNVSMGDLLEGENNPCVLEKALIATPPLPRQSARLDTKPKMSIPVISGQTPACAGNGNGIETAIAEAEDFIDVDRDAFPILDDLRRPFAIYVDGDSMEEMNIPDGSMAVINPAEDVRDGECALVCYKGLWSIKGIRWNKDGSVSLLAGKPQYNMVIPHEETEDDLWFSILGKVVGVHRWEQPRRFF